MYRRDKMRKVQLNIQHFAGSVKGQVYPVHNNKFYISTTGRVVEPATITTIIRGLENFAPSINATTETWNDMTEGGWERNAITGKGLNIAFTGKRQYGDAGNDYIAKLMIATGPAVETTFLWELPNGDKLQFDCVVNVTKPAGGDTTNIDSIEFEILSDGKPTYTPKPVTP